MRTKCTNHYCACRYPSFRGWTPSDFQKVGASQSEKVSIIGLRLKYRHKLITGLGTKPKKSECKKLAARIKKSGTAPIALTCTSLDKKVHKQMKAHGLK